MAIQVNTAETLELVQRACRQAATTGDKELGKAVNTVLSALTVVLRHRVAELPDECGPALGKLREEII